MYLDARDRIQANLGPFSYMYSYMSQPKQQLDTFKNWLGKGVSDISYYLNSHHIDFHEWCMGNKARPVSVTAAASTGVAAGKFNIVSCEDTITLTVQWENLDERGNFLVITVAPAVIILRLYLLQASRQSHWALAPRFIHPAG